MYNDNCTILLCVHVCMMCIYIRRWLVDWEKNCVKGVKKVGGAWGGANNQGEGAGFRAALLSGPPGIGKTTTAILTCEV